VIIFSGFSTASVAEGAIDLGAVRYLTKGADPEAINDAIEEVFSEARTGALADQVSPH
jgi:ActR/RegA family two-component response regulator